MILQFSMFPTMLQGLSPINNELYPEDACSTVGYNCGKCCVVGI